MAKSETSEFSMITDAAALRPADTMDAATQDPFEIMRHRVGLQSSCEICKACGLGFVYARIFRGGGTVIMYNYVTS